MLTFVSIIFKKKPNFYFIINLHRNIVYSIYRISICEILNDT